MWDAHNGPMEQRRAARRELQAMKDREQNEADLDDEGARARRLLNVPDETLDAGSTAGAVRTKGDALYERHYGAGRSTGVGRTN